jgi:hypothetical protein
MKRSETLVISSSAPLGKSSSSQSLRSLLIYIHVDDLVNRHIIGWSRIPPNWFRDKLCT